MIAKIYSLILLAIGGIVLTIALFASQKKNDEFERKGVIYYALISSLFFFVLGLFSLVADNNLSLANWSLQSISILFGVFHAWFLFTNYEWTSHNSFWPETLTTLLIFCFTALGLLGGLWVWYILFDLNLDYTMMLFKTIVWLPLPYFVLRTYDYILQIPNKKFAAWKFPEASAPFVNLRDENVIFVYIDVYTKSKNLPAGRISLRRTKLPKDATLVDYFQNFIKFYNNENSHQPIENLRRDESDSELGWVFYGKRSNRGRRWLLSPFQLGVEQLREGNIIQARRVPLGKEVEKSKLAVDSHEVDLEVFEKDRKSDDSKSDDGIVFTEK